MEAGGGITGMKGRYGSRMEERGREREEEGRGRSRDDDYKGSQG